MNWALGTEWTGWTGLGCRRLGSRTNGGGGCTSAQNMQTAMLQGWQHHPFYFVLAGDVASWLLVRVSLNPCSVHALHKGRLARACCPLSSVLLSGHNVTVMCLWVRFFLFV